MSPNTVETTQEMRDRLDRDRVGSGMFGEVIKSVHDPKVQNDLVFDAPTLSESEVIASELLEDAALEAAGLTPAWVVPAAPDLDAPTAPNRFRETVPATPALIQQYRQGANLVAAATAHVQEANSITPAAANPNLIQMPVWSTAPAASPLHEPASDASFWGPPSAAELAASKAEGERLMEAYRNRDDSDDEINAYPAAKLAPAPTFTPAASVPKKRNWFQRLRQK